MIARRSKKRSKQERLYTQLRKDYLNEQPFCEVDGCDSDSSEIHHMAGRVGELLTDVTKFLAVCRPHHRYIEANPIEAKEKGYSLSRLSTTN
jgi:hypothetical protein